MTEIKDVIHLYLGCDVLDGDGNILTLTSVGIFGYTAGNKEDGHYIKGSLQYCSVKPTLRPLSDMTEKERREFHVVADVNDNKEQCEAKSTLFLLSKHFDLFGLIEAGLAIDKTTISTLKTNGHE